MRAGVIHVNPNLLVLKLQPRGKTKKKKKEKKKDLNCLRTKCPKIAVLKAARWEQDSGHKVKGLISS